jgi:hypothetical protein
MSTENSRQIEEDEEIISGNFEREWNLDFHG